MHRAESMHRAETSPPETSGTARSRVAGMVALVAVVLVAATAAALVAAMIVPHHRAVGAHSLTARDMNGDVVTLDGVRSPSPAATTAGQLPHRGARLVVPAVGLDVPLGAIDMVDGQITPPGFRSAYLIRNLGVSPDRGEEGTVFVVMHALRGGGRGPGNYLTDIATGTSTLHRGEAIELDGVRYRVTGWHAIGKHSISDATDVWAEVPGRLVLITCLERPDGSASTHNLVVIATRE